MENLENINEEEELRNVIAENLAYYRKANNLTQAKLAELLSYSDKAVSKWERGDGIPDVYILKKLADIYHITVNDLISKKKKRTNVPFFQNRLVITLLSIGIAWLTATVVFSILAIIANNIPDGNKMFDWLWLFYIYPIPISFIIALVFAKIWGKRWYRFFIITGIIFGTGLTIFCTLEIFKVQSSWLIWILCTPIEVLNVLWYTLRRKKKDID